MFKFSRRNTHRLLYSFAVLILGFFLFGLYALYDIRTMSGLTRTICNHPLVVSEQKMLGLTAYARTKASEFMQETEETKSRLNVTTIFFLLLGIFISVTVALFTIKQAASSERSLKESENRYRMLVESQVDLVSRFKSDVKYNFVNEVFCQFFDKSKGELIGYEWQPLSVDDDPEYIAEELAKLSPQNPTVIIENQVYSGQGEIHWMQFINKGSFDSEAKLLEIQSVGRDITERKHSEKLVKESLKEKEVLPHLTKMIVRM